LTGNGFVSFQFGGSIIDVNDSAGNAGQVLRSDGMSTGMQWENPPWLTIIPSFAVTNFDTRAMTNQSTAGIFANAGTFGTLSSPSIAGGTLSLTNLSQVAGG